MAWRKSGPAPHTSVVGNCKKLEYLGDSAGDGGYGFYFVDEPRPIGFDANAGATCSDEWGLRFNCGPDFGCVHFDAKA